MTKAALAVRSVGRAEVLTPAPYERPPTTGLRPRPQSSSEADGNARGVGLALPVGLDLLDAVEVGALVVERVGVAVGDGTAVGVAKDVGRADGLDST